MPGGMFKRIVYMSPGAGIVYQYHQAYRSATENIKGIKALVQSNQLKIKCRNLTAINGQKSEMKYFAGMSDTSVFIHPSAVVDAGAQIGSGTKIWHFCHLMPLSKIGENCIVGQNVYIDNNTVIGNRVKIQNNVSIYNGVILEDDVFVGPSVVFTNVINPRSFIERKTEFRKTIIHKGASIGANATLLCSIEVGQYAMIGAGAIVTKNVAAYALMTGNPAVQTGWISEAGHRLDFDAENKARCNDTGQIYNLYDNTVAPLK